jgi:hypothetical protein
MHFSILTSLKGPPKAETDQAIYDTGWWSVPLRPVLIFC